MEKLDKKFFKKAINKNTNLGLALSVGSFVLVVGLLGGSAKFRKAYLPNDVEGMTMLERLSPIIILVFGYAIIKLLYLIFSKNPNKWEDTDLD